MYVDDSKSRYKGTISLDRDAAPILIVKNADKKRKVARQCYFVIKVGKDTFQFTCDSFRELTEWCALIRQAMDVGKSLDENFYKTAFFTFFNSLAFSGTTFSGIITEPTNISQEPINIKFTSNCIAVINPIKEQSLKTWLLHKITSFGQCGGIFTFEVCLHCSDSSAVSRCSVNLIQEKPTMILNLLERAIRSNPNTSEIHYERSILGDIYHCGHDCAQPGRLMPAYSDPNIFSSGGSFTPPRISRVSVDVHPRDQVESIDSGLPGTPQPEELSNGLPSPTSSYRSNPFRSPRHHIHYPRSPTGEDDYERNLLFQRRQSDEPPSRRRSDNLSSPSHYSAIKTADNSPVKHPPSPGRVHYALIDHSAPARMIRTDEYDSSSNLTSPSRVPSQDHRRQSNPTSPGLANPRDHTRDSHLLSPSIIRSGDYGKEISLTRDDFLGNSGEQNGEKHQLTPTISESETVTDSTTEQEPRERRNNYNKLKTLEESTEAVDDVIYDVPNCEFLSDPFALSPVSSQCDPDTTRSPNHHTLIPSPQHNTTSPDSSLSPSILSPSHQAVEYTVGTDIQDREEDYVEAWVPPVSRRKGRGGEAREHHRTNHTKNHVLATRDTASRKRFQSSSDVLDSPATSDDNPNHRRDTNGRSGTHRPRTASVGLHNSDRHLDNASNDFLKRLNEEEEKLSKVLAASRRERNEEINESREARDRLRDLNKPYAFTLDDLDHEHSDPDAILETCSNLVDYQLTRSHPSYVGGRMLPVHKEPTNNIKGYAYKVTIPYTNTQYDVPRRAAAPPDLKTFSHSAPPKPKRHISTERLYFVKS